MKKKEFDFNRAGYRAAVRNAGVFLLLGLAWIYFSDRLVLIVTGGNAELLTSLQTYKGIVFILISSMLIYYLSRHALARQARLTQKLGLSEHRYTKVVNDLQVGIYHRDEQGRLTYVNPKTASLFDRKEAELLESGLLAYIRPEDRPEVMQAWEVSKDRKKMFYQQYCVLQQGITPVWVLDIAYPEYADDGELTGFIGTLTDLSRIKQIEEEIVNKETLYSTILDHNLDSIALFDQDGGLIREFSGNFAKLMGYTREEAEGLQVRDIMHPDDRADYEEVLERVKARPGVTINYQIRVQARDGKTRWLDYSFTNMLDNPVIDAILGNGRDITEIKLAEQELAGKESFFRKLVEHSWDNIVLLDDQARVKDHISGQIYKSLGYATKEQYYQLGTEDLMHPEDQPRVSGIMQELAADPGGTRYLEARFIGRNGETRWIECAITNLLHDTDVGGFLINSHDITDRKLADEALKTNQRMLQALMDNLPGIVYRCFNDDHWSMEFVSQGAKKLTGHDPESFTSRTLHLNQIIHPDNREQVRAVVDAALLKRKPFELEYRIRHADGSTRWVWERGQGIAADDGSIEVIEGLIIDITERKLAQARQMELRNRLNLASQAGNVGLWDWDLVTDEVYFSPQWKKQVGYSDDEMPNELAEWQSRIHPEEKESVMAEIMAYTHQKAGSCQSEYRFKHKNGAYRWILARSVIEYDKNMKPLRLRGSHIDITDIRETQKELTENKRRVEQLLEANPVVLYAIEDDHGEQNLAWASDSIERVLGYSVEQASKPGWWPGCIHPEDRERCVSQRKGLEDTRGMVQEFRLLHKNGHSIYVRDEFRFNPDTSPGKKEMIGCWSDVTARYEERERMKLYATAFEKTNEGVIITGLDGSIISVNPAYQEIMGYTEDELLGQNPRMLQSGRHDRMFYHIMWTHLQKHGHWQGEIWNRRKNGEVFPQWLTLNIVNDESGQPRYYVGVATDITMLKQTEDELDQLTHYDTLTHLPNKLLLQSRIEHAIDQAERHNTRLGVLSIDLDNFQLINDSLGHSFGDELLVAVSRQWSASLRREDTLGRLSGDNFILLIESLSSVDDAGLVASNLLGQLATPFTLREDNEFYAEASIGISIFPDDAADAEGLLQNADTALNRAKAGGGRQFSYYTGDMGLNVNERLDLETSLRSAISRGEMLLHYQPKVAVRTGLICGAEALIRWNRDKRGLVPPGKFIPVAEKSNLIEPIGEWVIETACRQLEDWISRGLEPVPVAVNISVKQFANMDLARLIITALEAYHLQPQMLALELTESALMTNPESAIEILNPLKEHGLNLSLDDFGTGFSNLAYLARLPIDVLKVDSSFVQRIETDRGAFSLVKSIIDLAMNLGLETVAEGVETRAQLDILGSFGCNEIQGYYFSKPIPASEFEALLVENRKQPFETPAILPDEVEYGSG